MKTREQTYDVLIEENVPAAMRDGAVLRADIWRPDAEGRFPGLLIRTPYGKSSYKSTFEWAVERGYVVISQDIRGRYTSDGEFHPLFLGSRFEAQDGYDTVEWVASLPYCNGNVGVFGCSYNAWTAWELAWTRPPHLVAMFVGGIGARSTDGPFHPVLRTGCLLYWLINTMAPDTRRMVRGPKPWAKEEAIKLWEENRWKWIWFLPLRDIPERVLGGLASHFREWMRAPNVDYWRFREKHKEISVPVFQFTGWYDRQALGTIDHYTRMVKNAKTIRARRGQKLLIGPWSHGWGAGAQAKIGDTDFGPEAVIDYRFQLMVRWFDYWLNGIDNGILDEPPVRIFVMGANSWRYESEWPLARTQYKDFYFHSGGAANTPSGDGVLSLDPPGDEPTDSYVYDPRDPVPTLYLLSGQDAPRDQRLLDHRQDVLVFATEPLTREVEVTGTAKVKLWASSSARDTDFTVKLVDVHPDGFAQNLCYGIIRARFRESFEEPKLIEPGEIYQYTIELQPTSNLFKVGHCVRLDVSSSDFPNFDRNHNTGAEDYEYNRLIRATQTIYHDRRHPSKVILPIIPSERDEA